MLVGGALPRAAGFVRCNLQKYARLWINNSCGNWDEESGGVEDILRRTGIVKDNKEFPDLIF